MRELELKLSVDEAFEAPKSLPEKTGVARMEELPPLKLNATYYDTPDLRLARHGVTLRHRNGEPGKEPWTVKIPVRGDGAERQELHFAGSDQTVPGEALDLVTAFARRTRVRPVARLRTLRGRWSLLATDGTELAELTDDRVAVLRRGRIVDRFRELEIEAVKGDRRALEAIAKALQGAGASPPEPTPKVVRALGPRALEPPDFSTSKGPAPSRPAAYAVQAAIGEGLERIALNDPGARLGDPEAVHQSRVGARRLRSDLRTFSPLLKGKRADGLAADLKWLATALGEVRDLDVTAGRFRAEAAGLNGQLAPLFALVDERRTSAHERLLEKLRSDRYLALLDGLVRAHSNPPLSGAASKPAQNMLKPLVARRWKKLARDARSLDGRTSDEELHRFRIRAKRLRYAAEAVRPALGRKDGQRAKRLARRAEELQDVLGEMQDATVANGLVQEAAALHPRKAPFNFAAGQLVERQEEDVRRARSEFERVWERANRKELWGWLKS